MLPGSAGCPFVCGQAVRLLHMPKKGAHNHTEMLPQHSVLYAVLSVRCPSAEHQSATAPGMPSCRKVALETAICSRPAQEPQQVTTTQVTSTLVNTTHVTTTHVTSTCNNDEPWTALSLAPFQPRKGVCRGKRKRRGEAAQAAFIIQKKASQELKGLSQRAKAFPVQPVVPMRQGP